MSGYGIANAIGFNIGSFTPKNISNLQLWLDASQLNLSNDTAVSSWTDNSGNGYNATQGTLANRPTFKTNILNGRPSLLFDGTDSLSIPSSTSNFKFLHSTDSSLFIVLQPGVVSDPAVNYILISTGASTANIGYSLRFADSPASNNGINSFIYFGSSGNTVVSNAVNNVLTANTFNYFRVMSQPTNGTAANRSEIQVDLSTVIKNNTQTNTASTSNSSSNLFIGQSDTGAFPFSGYISEIIIYNKILSSSETTSVQNYIRSKYRL